MVHFCPKIPPAEKIWKLNLWENSSISASNYIDDPRDSLRQFICQPISGMMTISIIYKIQPLPIPHHRSFSWKKSIIDDDMILLSKTVSWFVYSLFVCFYLFFCVCLLVEHESALIENDHSVLSRCHKLTTTSAPGQPTLTIDRKLKKYKIPTKNTNFKKERERSSQAPSYARRL